MKRIPAQLIYSLKYPFKLWAYELLDQVLLNFFPAKKGGGVLIFRLDLIGDYLMSRPFFAAIKNNPAFAGKAISYAGNQQLSALAENLDAGIFDSFFWIDRPRFINSIFYRFRVLRDIRSRGFDLLIYPSHTRQFWLESVVRVSGAREKITPSSVGQYMSALESGISLSNYTRIVDTGKAARFEFHRNRDFFASISTLAGEVKNLHHLALISKQRKPLVLIAPGASTAERRWPESQFAALLKELSRMPGLRFAIIGAPGESQLADRILALANVPEIENLAGRFSLPQSMELIAEASLLVSNESGPVHMAATTGTACVCISNGNHFGRWNPYPAELASNILTVYPARFGDVSSTFESLVTQYHNRSEIPASEVEFDSVLKACRMLLAELMPAIGHYS